MHAAEDILRRNLEQEARAANFRQILTLAQQLLDYIRHEPHLAHHTGNLAQLIRDTQDSINLFEDIDIMNRRRTSATIAAMQRRLPTTPKGELKVERSMQGDDPEIASDAASSTAPPDHLPGDTLDGFGRGLPKRRWPGSARGPLMISFI